MVVQQPEITDDRRQEDSKGGCGAGAEPFACGVAREQKECAAGKELVHAADGGAVGPVEAETVGEAVPTRHKREDDAGKAEQKHGAAAADEHQDKRPDEIELLLHG